MADQEQSADGHGRPAVSVVIPVFNRAAEVGPAIGTVLGQSFVDFEIVVVDDASTDATVSIVEAIDDPRIRIVALDRNRGPGGARNAGVAAARAAVVAFLDSDDRWRPEKLERQLAFMCKRNLSVCCTAFELHRPNKAGAEVRLPDPPRLTAEDMIEKADVCIGTTMAVERAFFDRVGPFDERLRRLEDWDWLLRLARLQPLEFLSDPLAIHYAPASRDAAAVTRAAAALILEKHAASVAAIDPRLGRRLRAMAARHVAAADWISGRRLATVVSGARALWLAPRSGLSFARNRFLGG